MKGSGPCFFPKKLSASRMPTILDAVKCSERGKVDMLKRESVAHETTRKYELDSFLLGLRLG